MNIEVVLLPRDLRPGQLTGRACAVFDVLRATTTMAAALTAGVKEIRLFGNLESARASAATFTGSKFLCGESQCLPPEGFDLGNSPGQFSAGHDGATLFMCTTNGTRALLAATDADPVFTAALVNARAAAKALRDTGKSIALLCAGTNGAPAMEDLLGAGSVIAELPGAILANDITRIAAALFQQTRSNLAAALRDCDGGRNVAAAGLGADIEFAARLNALEAVGIAGGDPLAVRRY